MKVKVCRALEDRPEERTKQNVNDDAEDNIVVQRPYSGSKASMATDITDRIKKQPGSKKDEKVSRRARSQGNPVRQSQLIKTSTMRDADAFVELITEEVANPDNSATSTNVRSNPSHFIDRERKSSQGHVVYDSMQPTCDNLALKRIFDLLETVGERVERERLKKAKVNTKPMSTITLEPENGIIDLSSRSLNATKSSRLEEAHSVSPDHLFRETGDITRRDDQSILLPQLLRQSTTLTSDLQGSTPPSTAKVSPNVDVDNAIRLEAVGTDVRTSPLWSAPETIDLTGLHDSSSPQSDCFLLTQSEESPSESLMQPVTEILITKQNESSLSSIESCASGTHTSRPKHKSPTVVNEEPQDCVHSKPNDRFTDSGLVNKDSSCPRYNSPAAMAPEATVDDGNTTPSPVHRPLQSSDTYDASVPQNKHLHTCNCLGFPYRTYTQSGTRELRSRPQPWTQSCHCSMTSSWNQINYHHPYSGSNHLPSLPYPRNTALDVCILPSANSKVEDHRRPRYMPSPLQARGLPTTYREIRIQESQRNNSGPPERDLAGNWEPTKQNFSWWRDSSTPSNDILPPLQRIDSSKDRATSSLTIPS